MEQKTPISNSDGVVSTVSYGDLARLFLKMSLFAFGGPVAHLAMGEDEIVTRRRWLTREHYLDLIAASNLIPGPNSTEVMIHVGYVTRGIPGAILAGACFITPAMLLTLALTALYVATGAIPTANAVLWGIAPVIVGVIAVAAYRLFPPILKERPLLILAILSALALAVVGLPEVVVMLGAGVIYTIWVTARPALAGLIALLPAALPVAQTAVAEALARPGALDLFGYFLRIGAVLFGSGYVLVAYIQQDLAQTFGWLTAREVLDAVAIGQFTPGPVLTTATAVGYIAAGVPGAIAATVGIFLPAFVLVIVTAPLIARMRASRATAAFLAGVNAGVIAAIVLTTLALTVEAVQPIGGGALNWTSAVALAIGVGTALAIVRLRINTTWLLLSGAAIGALVGALG